MIGTGQSRACRDPVIGQRTRLGEFNYGAFNPEAKPLAGNGQSAKAPGNGSYSQSHRAAAHRRRAAPSKRGVQDPSHRSAGLGHRPGGRVIYQLQGECLLAGDPECAARRTSPGLNPVLRSVVSGGIFM